MAALAATFTAERVVAESAVAGRSPPPLVALPKYYDAKVAALYLGDAVQTMAQLPAAAFDIVFADPPYGLSNGGMSCHAGRRVSVNKGEWDKSRGAQGDFDFHRQWINACRRLLKDDGSLWVSGTYHSIYACGFALQQGGWHILNDITWYKPNAAPHLACRMFAASHESLVWARKDKKAKHYFDYALMRNNDWNGDIIKKPNKQMRSVWAINTPPPREKIHGKHPTQKPLALLERVVLSSSRKGGMVLDPFCGSATTGVAAVRHGRRFVGIDNSREYLDNHAIPRLSDELRAKRK